MAYERKNWYHLLPDSKKEIDNKNLKLFFNLMIERQNIWYKRFLLGAPAPWTKNKFFKNHKFTNVYRDLDRNSQWLIRNIILKENDKRNLIWKILLYRIFNNPELFIWISFQETSFNSYFPDFKDYNRDELANLIIEYRELGKKPFTSAYFINPNCRGMTRTEHYAKNVVFDLFNSVEDIYNIMKTSSDPEDLIIRLEKCRAVASFISHEFYQDFTYPEIYTNKRLMNFDQDDYTNVGDGAALGIRLIFPSLVGKKQKEAIYILRDYANDHLSDMGFKFLNWDKKKQKYYVKSYGEISLHVIEMWCCEFSKYWKMKVGLGKQRGKFIPRTNVTRQ